MSIMKDRIEEIAYEQQSEFLRHVDSEEFWDQLEALSTSREATLNGKILAISLAVEDRWSVSELRGAIGTLFKPAVESMVFTAERLSKIKPVDISGIVLDFTAVSTVPERIEVSVSGGGCPGNHKGWCKRTCRKYVVEFILDKDTETSGQLSRENPGCLVYYHVSCPGITIHSRSAVHHDNPQR